jgi:hypothetical protein
MAKRRKTTAERKAAQAGLAWEALRDQLQSAKTFKDAREVANLAPPSRSTSNLLFFLDHLGVPADSSREEKGLYLQLIQRNPSAVTARGVDPERVQQELRLAIQAQGPL